MTQLQLVGFLLLFKLAHGLIGYECGARTVNVTTISLLNVDECDIPTDSINVTRKYIQLLQIIEYTETRVIQCKLEVRRTIYHCGSFSHISLVKNGESEYIAEISPSACLDVHQTGILKYGDREVIHGIRNNHTVVHGLTFAGSLDSDGNCQGTSYADPYGSWESIVVQGTLKITLTSYTARVSLNTNQIHLNSGVMCPHSAATCLDTEGGQTFWNPLPVDRCRFDRYGILYQGYANKIVDSKIKGGEIIYSLTTQGITFALSARNKESVCGYTLTRTEHPKLIVFETLPGESFASQQKISVSNLDLFAYMNSKFVYVEKHIKTQMKQLYLDVIGQKCELERQTLKNSLTIATQAPDEFAYTLMKGPGYMAVVAAQVVHIIKCIPIEVRLEHGNNCYAELQVSHKNNTYFLTPRTHILKTLGTKVNCNALLPSYYSVGEYWYKILPRPTEALPPMTMKPSTQMTWKYMNPAELATSGIYTEQDLHDLKERIMFPVEKPALLNDLAREINGHSVTDKEGTLSKLLNPDTVAMLAESTWNRIWEKFTTFGIISAGFLTIVMIIQFIKSIVNLIITGYTLHSIYGWSIRLLAALCSSITHLFIYLQKSNSIQDSSNKANTDLEANVTPPEPTPRPNQQEEVSTSREFFQI